MKQKKSTRKKKAKPAKKLSRAKKITMRAKAARKKPLKKAVKRLVRKKRARGGAREFGTRAALEQARINPRGAGASGDNQKLSQVEDVDSESVEELVDEGQAYEAAAISGVEDALDPDQGEVTTKQVPEDDVPEEYKERDQ